MKTESKIQYVLVDEESQQIISRWATKEDAELALSNNTSGSSFNIYADDGENMERL